MFSILNRSGVKGNDSARMCKILDPLSKLFHVIRRSFPMRRYPFEDAGFSGPLFGRVGPAIALMLLQPVAIRIRGGKD